jgi:hypothetical protein
MTNPGRHESGVAGFYNGSMGDEDLLVATFRNYTIDLNTVETAIYWYHGFGLLWTCALIEGIW